MSGRPRTLVVGLVVGFVVVLVLGAPHLEHLDAIVGPVVLARVAELELGDLALTLFTGVARREGTRRVGASLGGVGLIVGVTGLVDGST